MAKGPLNPLKLSDKVIERAAIAAYREHSIQVYGSYEKLYEIYAHGNPNWTIETRWREQPEEFRRYIMDQILAALTEGIRGWLK